MTYSLPRKTETLVERRAAELGLTPSAYLERLIELDVGGGAVEEALLDAIDEPAEEWDWDGMLTRGLGKAKRHQ
jgi:hypothetical protein